MHQFTAAALIAAAAGTAHAQCIQETLLEPLPGHTTCFANNVSEDGFVVVGSSTASGAGQTRAFRWTHAGGMQNLGTLPGATTSTAADCSADGSVVVGTSGPNIYRWTAATGMVSLGRGIGVSAVAQAVSADGSVIAGHLRDATNADRAFRWTAATGIEIIGPAVGFLPSQAHGISSDGTVIAGGVYSVADGYRMARWTAETGMVDVGAHLGDETEGLGISPDGSTIAGLVRYDDADFQHVAMSWGPDGNNYFDGSQSPGEGTDASRTGTYIVGTTGRFGSWEQAYVYARDGRMRPIADIANDTNRGSRASGISTDGTVVVGRLLRRSDNRTLAAIWTLPNVDFNEDGFVDFFDYDAYVLCFETGSCPPGHTADFNRDGFVDFFDYDRFVQVYETGC